MLFELKIPYEEIIRCFWTSTYASWNFLLIYKEPKGKKYLAPRVNTVQLVAVCGVPEANTSISCSTSRCKKASLVG